MGYVNLHVHSEGSLLDGLTKVKEVVDTSIKFNQSASCITDHGVLYTVPDHYKYALEQGQKPIIGFEAYVAKNHLIKEKDDVREHFILLAKNNEGYKTLSYICSEGATKGFYYRPRIDDDIMIKYGTKDLIATSACLAGRIPKCLLKDDIEGAEHWCKYYAKMFPNSFYLELQPTAEDGQVKVNKGLIELSKKLGLPLVATTDSHYTTKDQKEAHDMLLCMQSKDKWDNPHRWKFKGNTYYLMNEEQIIQAFKENGHEVLDQNAVLEAIHNTVDVANQCNVTFDLTQHYLPKLPPPNDDDFFNYKVSVKQQEDPNFIPDDFSYLKHLCIQGLKKLKPKIMEDEELRNKYLDRLNWELETIKDMRFPSYFLIVSEYINWASERMGVGPGRGCAVENMMVNTKKENKYIQDVQIGDIVKGHDEKEHKVVDVLQYDCDEEVVNITTENNKNLCMTKDHKIYAIKKKNYDNGIRTPDWITMNELEEGDYIAEL